MEFENSVALVTGGASGLGLGTVQKLAGRGAKVAIVDLPSSNGEAIAKELGGGVAFFGADVTNADDVDKVFEGVEERFGRLDVCVNSAGTGVGKRILSKDGEMFPLDLYRKVVDLNLIGLFDMVRHAARLMSKNEPGIDDERGLIVNVASIAGYEGQVGQAAYSASKGAVIASTLPLARDLAQWGIRVLTVAPGIMDTAMLAGVSDQVRNAVIDIALFPRRLGTPEDFAGLIAHFMENTMLNGEVVRLDAGARLAVR